MLVSSILNSITFKSLTGTYPNKDNTLHNERRHGNRNVIAYAQKFPVTHTLYIQFESDVATDITLTSYVGLSQIETITKTFDTSFGTSNKRYYTNFSITLDGDYTDKKAWFKAVQGTDILTSEPVLSTDISEAIQKGWMKYVKYSNVGRIESDLSDRFIDWTSIQNDGHYMDFFIEAVDLELNDSDDVEILEGSQSRSIISASYFSGVVLKTGPVPDYMVTRLGMASSVDVFEMNGIRYVKQGEAEGELFGGSTSYQCTVKLTQKYTVGSNTDQFGLPEPEDPPIDPTLFVYIGAVDNLNPTESQVKAMSTREGIKLTRAIHYDVVNQLFCFAYPSSFGPLLDVRDDSEFSVASGFEATTRDFTMEGVTVNYTIYTFTRYATTDNYLIVYEF